MIEMKSQRGRLPGKKKTDSVELETERHTAKARQQKRDEGKGKKEGERNGEDESVL